MPIDVKARDRQRRSDAQLWAQLIDVMHASGVPEDDLPMAARAAVAVVRRVRDGVDTWAAGDTVPDDVSFVYDLDGYLWLRQHDGAQPMGVWSMAGFRKGYHLPELEGAWVQGVVFTAPGGGTRAPWCTKALPWHPPWGPRRVRSTRRGPFC